MKFRGISLNKKYLFLFILLAVAISSRLINIGTQSIYVDETWVVPNTNFHFDQKDIFPKLFTYKPFLDLPQEWQKLARKIYDAHPLFQIAALHAASDSNPPLFFFLNYYWGRWFGYEEATIRTPAAIYSIITILLLFFVLRSQQFDFGVRMVILSLVILSPIFLYFSNLARAYTLLILISLFSCYLSSKVLRTDFQRKWVSLYLITAIACMYTHYYGILVVISQVFYLFLESYLARKKENFLKVLLLGTLLAVAILPVFTAMFVKGMYLPQMLGGRPRGFVYFNPQNLKNLILSFGMAYSLSTIESWLNITLSTIQVILLGLGMGYLWKNRHSMSARFWLFFFLFPLALILLTINIRIYLFKVRYCMILFIPFSVLCGLGFYSLKNRMGQIVLAVFIGGIGLFYIYYGMSFGNTKGKEALEDWRATARFLKAQKVDLPVYVYPPSYRDSLYYYIPDAQEIRGFPEKKGQEGINDRNYTLVLMKPESSRYSIEKKIERELPFLEKREIQKELLGQFPRIYVFRVKNRGE